MFYHAYYYNRPFSYFTLVIIHFVHSNSLGARQEPGLLLPRSSREILTKTKLNGLLTRTEKARLKFSRNNRFQ